MTAELLLLDLFTHRFIEGRCLILYMSRVPATYSNQFITKMHFMTPSSGAPLPRNTEIWVQNPKAFLDLFTHRFMKERGLILWYVRGWLCHIWQSSVHWFPVTTITMVTAQSAGIRVNVNSGLRGKSPRLAAKGGATFRVRRYPGPILCRSAASIAWRCL